MRGSHLIIAALLLSGCGLGPGDYVVYRVSFSTPDLTSDCYPDGEVPSDRANDSTTFRETGTFILYTGAEDDLYLDTGEVTIAGARTDDGYEFIGETVDVDYFGDADANSETWIDTTTVDVMVSGPSIQGTLTAEAEYFCTGADCPVDSDQSCTQTVDFVGTEIHDLQLFYPVE